MRVTTTIELAESFGCSVSDLNNLISRGFVDAADLQPTSPGQPRIWQEAAAVRLGAALKLHRAGFDAESAVGALRSQTDLTTPSARWFVLSKSAAKVGTAMTVMGVLDESESHLLPEVIAASNFGGFNTVSVIDLADLRARINAAILKAAKRWAPPSEAVR